ncbi:alpha/beta fold hydrolase [Micromonospora sp. DT53]|uniref:alpha/beta fold hydrolase n=1 Tax=Micromonospora sp. DT53 TaxID=3393444 RepID=UPI003CF0348F
MAHTPIVLVHGFYHGSWAWAEVVTELSARGRTGVAVDLAAHGLHAVNPAAADRRPFDPVAYATERSRVADIGLDAAADLLATRLGRIGGGRAVCVVAHSMGGAVLSRVVEKNPGLVAHMVYLAAYMPASDTPCIAYPALPEAADNTFMPLLVGDPAATGALRIDPRNPDPAVRNAIREAFYGDVASERAAAATSLLSCDAPLAMATESTTLTAAGWGSVPRTYVVCSHDRTIPAPLQRLFIAQADAAFPDNLTAVTELAASHSAFLSSPGRVADVIAGLP